MPSLLLTPPEMKAVDGRGTTSSSVKASVVSGWKGCVRFVIVVAAGGGGACGWGGGRGMKAKRGRGWLGSA